MIISCIGHAKFLIELENGLRIVTDPYDATCGYPVTEISADVVLVSHGHHDHSAVDTVRGVETVIDAAGTYALPEDVTIRAVEADHDDAGGSKRGKTLLFCIEAEGLRVMHLGDLGHVPTEAQLAALGSADVLMIPVGGFYTIDAPTAVTVAGLLNARVVLPMHYKTSANADWPIAGIEAYTALCDEPVEFLDLLRVARGDLSCQPASAVLKPTSLR
ncbi:MAG: MBL fold metallo-hydrolase [Clostridiales bacterium]|nr:MBL fold metallo-hydrolase [Clostridiales bacterium]